MLKLNWNRHRKAPESLAATTTSTMNSITATTASPAPDRHPSRSPGETSSAACPVFGVLGAKGGVGGTTLSINLAYALARSYGSLTLLDANLQQPDIAVLLSREPDYSLLDLLPRLDDLDERMLAGVAVNLDAGASSLALLSPPLTGEAVGRADLSDIAQLISRARPYSPGWVVDLPRNLDRHLVTMLDLISITVLVFEPTLASVAAARRWLTVLEELDYPQDRVVCVLNRAGGRLRSVERQLENGLAGRSVHKIPNAYELSEGCSIDGTPALSRHPREPYSRAVVELAMHLRKSIGKAGNGLTPGGAVDA